MGPVVGNLEKVGRRAPSDGNPSSFKLVVGCSWSSHAVLARLLMILGGLSTNSLCPIRVGNLGESIQHAVQCYSI